MDVVTTAACYEVVNTASHVSVFQNSCHMIVGL